MSYDVEGNRIQDELMPKAIVHVKILDAAKSDPEASIQGIADEVDGASLELVERVLEKYGDPGGTGSESGIGNLDECGGEMNESQPDNHHEIEQAMDTDQTGPTPTTTESASEGDRASTDDAKQSIAETGSRDDRGTESDIVDVASDSGVVDERGTTDTTREQTATGNEETAEEPSNERSLPDSEQLTSKQLDVLRAIGQRPHATQSELADQFDVSRATISQRVNAIDGFDWTERQEFVQAMFDGDEKVPENNSQFGTSDELVADVDDLVERIDALERRLEETAAAGESTFEDPATVGTIIRACIDSNTVPEDAEEEIIVKLIEAGRS